MLEASSSLPLEEEEPPRMSYAAAENLALIETDLASIRTIGAKPRI